MDVIVTVNPTPRQKFQSVKSNVDQHRDLIAREDFTRAINVALDEFSDNLTKITRPELAAAAFFNLQGAREFVSTLKNLAEQSSVKAFKTPSDNLKR